MVFLWFSYGFPMVLLQFSYAHYDMKSLFIKTNQPAIYICITIQQIQDDQTVLSKGVVLLMEITIIHW